MTESTATPTTNQPRRRFLGIQALRIVAALMVVFTHSTFYASERLDHAFPVWERGTRGVDIFFVISGFVMIFASQKLITVPGGYKIFAIQRIIRIVPLYWLLTTAKVILLLLTTHLALHTSLNPITAVCSYLFLPARNLDGKIEPLIGVGWTLNFEMLFYLLFTCALFFRQNVFRFLGLALLLLSIASLFRKPEWPAASFYLNSIVLEFYFGMLIAKACMKGRYLSEKIAYPLLLLGFFLLLLPPFEWNVLPKAIVSGLPAAMIVWAVASLERIERKIPHAILYLGDASYSIYLIHAFVCPLPPTILARLHWNSPWSAVLLSVVSGVAAGCLLHRFVETRLSELFRKWTQIKPKPQMVTS